MRIFIVAGGTGGHLFPAIRLAEEIISRAAAEVLFIASSRKQDSDILREKNIEFWTLPIIGIQRRNIFAILNFLAMLFIGTLKSAYLLARFKPGCVIGFGGFSSGPIVLLASLSGVRTVIHEQNVFPGKANLLLARFVDRIAVNFEESKEYLRGFESKIVVSGNPLRRGLKRTEKSGDRFTVLVMGGSQGAHALNMLVPEALNMIETSRKNTLDVIHIAGHREKKAVEDLYKDKGIANRVFTFTHDMGEIYGESDFVIARAGATTVSELMYLGKPSILVPYPFAQGHQKLNAMVLERSGLAVMAEEHDLKAEVLRDIIIKFMDKKTLSLMSEKAGRVNGKDACSILMKEALNG
ncbi:MAG: undecaprenyldiphospho-muramoylpentapeptide beta-N-acetylglucosaminyltransferase [Candidatus Omnitrophica bacterium]|nr:undecaprenyldiphospho-muramoylpentapeptide beta-N-acetylglucosaminyltransferase [Candidatus Omnitrophota bacterium]MBU1932940.1 undecaprenyldiphospho-muramoylpentapeptide beta-N-acetylglucosaminyltransferase [Candidatus Omnitrophota bacterium]